MLDDAAFPIIFFMVSGFAFCIVLLWALARAWEKALTPRQIQSAKEWPHAISRAHQDVDQPACFTNRDNQNTSQK
ncbi:hypothetical protein [Hyphomicrobium sp. 2TAF46]|uniref:hypothetical protein n=1 Tax=Hyphomicrobium sp. 2TAF46 TaxID=3233019 RepID=UPI003F8DE53D